MFTDIIGTLEKIIEEIDSLVEVVQEFSDICDMEAICEPHFVEWSKDGSILDGGRSIRIKSFGLEGVHNVYDVLSSMHMHTVSHIDS
jgi:hypothetical protein